MLKKLQSIIKFAQKQLSCGAIFALVLAAMLLCGCENYSKNPAALGLRLWAAGEMSVLDDSLSMRTAQNCFTPDYAATTSRSLGTVTLESCANDQRGFIVVLDSFDSPLSDISIEVESLRDDKFTVNNQISTKIYRIAPVGPLSPPSWSVLVNSPAFSAWSNCYDALLEIAPGKLGNNFGLPAASRMMFWVDLDISPLAAAGKYNSGIKIRFNRADSIRQQTAAMDFTLNVKNILLPDSVALGNFDHRELLQHCVDSWTARAGKDDLSRLSNGLEPLAHVRELMQLAHAHGLDLFDTALAPPLKISSSARRELDWQSYDLLSGPYLNGRAFADKMGVKFWAAPVDLEFPSAGRFGGRNSDKYAAALKDFTKSTITHYSQRGFADKLIFIPSGELAVSESVEEFLHWAELVKGADEKTRIFSPFAPYPTRDISAAQAEKIAKLASDFILRVEDVSDSAENKTTNITGWLAPGTVPFSPPLSAGATAGDIRSFCYMAKRYCDGRMMLGNVLGWNADSSGGNRSLFYPAKLWGMQGIVPTVRLKILRRGLKDMALMRLLEMRGRQQSVEQLVGAITGWQQGDSFSDYDYLDYSQVLWPREPALWQSVDDILTGEFELSVASKQNQRTMQSRLDIFWTKLLAERGRLGVSEFLPQLNVRPDGVKMDLDFDLQLTLQNQRREVAAAVLEIPPSDGFRLSSASRSFGQLDVDESKNFNISFGGDSQLIDDSGHIEIPLWLRTGSFDAGKHTFTASLLINKPAAKNFSIDGDISDWKGSNYAVASGFGLAGQRGSDFSVKSRADKKLADDTQVRICSDDENIYIAAICETAGKPLHCRMDNMLKFERGYPCGEDFFEIVFDPAQRAETPSELYRLSVKANGVVLSNKGLDVDKKYNNYAGNVWLSQAKVAVKQNKTNWTAEIQIPLKSFDIDKTEVKKMWGINFIRFNVAANELSNWTKLSGGLYNPEKLGLLLFDLE